MDVIWKSHATKLMEYINSNQETQAHLFLEQLMLFPFDVQDKIIEDISQLKRCSSDSVAKIIHHYSMPEIR
jgi:hypothetical protein